MSPLHDLQHCRYSKQRSFVFSMKNHTPTSVTTRPWPMVMLHWATLLALCAGVSIIWIRDVADGRAARFWLMEAHTHVGLLVLGLWVARIVVRIRFPRLPVIGSQSLVVRVVAGFTHVCLYAWLLALPILGWASINAHGKTVDLFGLPLPSLVGSDDDLGDDLLTWHVNTAWMLLAFGIVHASAALWHHFVMRDALLRAMLPRRRR